MDSFFVSAYQYLKKRRIAFFTVVLILFGLLTYWASRITFEEDIAKLLPSSEETQQLSKIMEAVSFADKTVIMVHQEASDKDKTDPESLKHYADELLQGLTQEASGLIDKIQGNAQDERILDVVDHVHANLPLFLDKEDYQHIDSLTQPGTIALRVAELYQSLQTPSMLSNVAGMRSDPLGILPLGLTKFQQLQASGNFIMEDGYIMTPDRQHLFIFITPAASATETNQNEKFISLLDQQVQELNSRYSDSLDIKGEYFGATAMAVANAGQIKKDIQLTLGIALVLLVALFLYFYRQIHVPLVVIIPAAFGSLLGMAVLYLLKGTISAVSIGIGSVLLGITLDYSLHILSHYRNTGDIQALFKSTTKPLIMCAVFTAVDFLCLLFLRSDVLKDLGIFAAVSVLGAALFSLLFIPQIYKPSQALQSRHHTFIDKIALYDFEGNKWLKGILIIAIVLSLFTFRNVNFDNNLDHLNYRPDHLKAAEARLDTLTNGLARNATMNTEEKTRPLYLVSHADTYEEALRHNEWVANQLTAHAKLDTGIRINTLAGLISSREIQQQRLDLWQRYWTTEKKAEIRSRLISEGEKYGFRANTFQAFYEQLDETFEALDFQSDSLFNDLVLDEYIGTKPGLTTILTTIHISPRFEKQLTDRFEASEHVLAIDRRILQEQFLSNLEADFDTLFMITGIAMFVVIFLFFRSIELTLITNIPVFLGWLVTLGLMGIFQIPFNAFNMIITTLIFGLGIDYSIFITKGMLERFTYGKTDLPAYKSGILMSAIATLLCFGILIFAKHPAIRSISIIPLFGLLVVVMMAFTIQPWLFNFYLIRSQNKGNTPRKIPNILMTIYTFGYFFAGGFLLSILAQVLIPLIPASKKKKFYFLHRSMQSFFKGLMLGTPFYKVRILGKDENTFKKSVILIANHTSQLDTPTMGMLHDKLIFVVNNRVLNSKFFGKAIKMAGFYSTEQSEKNEVDDQLERLTQLREKVSQGYSVIIFPEGTRSRTAEIGRFHKGAFYLAQQLNLDIVPVMIHGNTDVLPKNDNVLKRSPITIQILPKIHHNDEIWGHDYSQRTKTISKYFKKEFRALRDNLEGPDYFRNKVRYNFTYKPSYIRKAALKTYDSQKANYHRLTRLLPNRAQILHLGCDYGVLDYWLAYDSAYRTILATDQDDTKIEILQNTYSVNRYAIEFIKQSDLKDKLAGAALPATSPEGVLIISDPTFIQNSTKPGSWSLRELLPQCNYLVMECATDDMPEFSAIWQDFNIFEKAGSVVIYKRK